MRDYRELALQKRAQKQKPHRFVLDAVASLEPTERAMFGALALYVGEKIVFILRDKKDDPQANGVWLAVSPENREGLRSVFPNAQPVRIMGKEISGWELLSAEAADFEESALRACELVVARDSRIGKVPKKKAR